MLRKRARSPEGRAAAGAGGAGHPADLGRRAALAARVTDRLAGCARGRLARPEDARRAQPARGDAHARLALVVARADRHALRAHEARIARADAFAAASVRFTA